MLFELINALEETLLMVFAAGILTLLLGLPLGILLAETRPKMLFNQAIAHKILSSLVQGSQSLPYVVLMIALMPLSRMIFGSEEGLSAAIVPLSLAAIPYFAAQCEQAFIKIPLGIRELAVTWGARPWQILVKIMIPEAKTELMQGFILTLIQLLGYSAIAGILGAGGLGALAIHKGYPNFQTSYVLAIAIILIALIQGLQLIRKFLLKSTVF